MNTPKRDSQSEKSNNAAPEKFLVLDTQLLVNSASQSFYDAFQAEPGQTLGKKLAEVGGGHWNIPALLTLLNELTKADGGDLEIEHEFPSLGRRTLLVRRLGPTDDAQSGMIGLSIRETTAPECIAGGAGKSLAWFRTALASIGDAVIVTTTESCITFINPAAEKLTGWNRKEALHKGLTDVFQIVNEQSVKMESPVIRAIREGEVAALSEQAVLIARDGSECPIENSAAPILDADGRTVGVVLVFHDVSNRQKVEQELESSELRYRRLFEAAHDGILILDAETAKVVDVNPFMSKLLGYPSEHFLGKELWEIGVYKDAEGAKEAMAILQRVGYIRYEDHPLQHKDGRHIPVEFVSNVYREGKRDVIQCNIRDIGERKHQAEELKKASAGAEAANKAKSDFLANMSHEIRTPMNAILGFAEMLLHKSPEECSQLGCVHVIRRNALHLLELVNDILDLSKVEAGHLKVDNISCDLPVLLSEIISLTGPRAVEKGLGFGVTFQGPIPRLIQTDPLRLRQILLNVLGNAMKFTESGRIDLRIMEEGIKSPAIMLRVDVIDSGIGMTPEVLERLFRPFTQGDESITRKFGGTGLGLTISRQLAKLLGGDVTVTSQPRMGSNFTLRINGGPSAGVERLHGLTEATLPANVNPCLSAEIYLRGRILLVEDGVDNQRLLRMQLSSAGASVVSAGNGQIALDLAKTQPFDLILMDMQMPVMDGYAATAELRRSGLTIPIIALTAYAMSEDRDKCLASGCDAYLSKPVDEGTLLATIDHYLGRPVPDQRADAGMAGAEAPTSGFSGFDRITSSLAGDPRMLEIIPEFVDRLPGKVRQMTDLLELNDLEGLRRVVHEITGTVGGYGFNSVTHPARKAEQAIKAGNTWESITADINSLIEVIRRIEGYDQSKAPQVTEQLVDPTQCSDCC